MARLSSRFSEAFADLAADSAPIMTSGVLVFELAR
jgi:hypothetical protein